MTNAHSRFSPSGAPRWMRCHASLPRQEAVQAAEGEEEAHPAAQWGTDSHHYLEQGLLIGLPPSSLVMAGPEESEKGECADVAFNYVQSLRAEHKPIVVRVEVRVDPGKAAGLAELEGTCDVLVATNDRLEAVDFKTGYNLVEPDSEQLALYLLGALNTYWPDRSVPCPFTTFRTTVIQPRAQHIDGPIRSMQWTLEELLTFEEQLIMAHASIISGQHQATPGEKQCKYCRAKPSCLEHQQWITGSMDMPEDSRMAATAEGLAEDRLSELLTLIPSIQNWIQTLQDQAKKRLQAGQVVPGWKLVRKAGRPTWNEDQLSTIKALRKVKLKKAQYIKDQLKTPLQVMKELEGDAVSEAVAQLWHRPDGPVSLVPGTAPGEDIMDGERAWMKTIK